MSRFFVATLASFAFLVAASTWSRAAEFSIQPSISLSESYSDNIDLDPDGEKQAAFVTDLSPGVSVRGTGPRLTTALDASVTGRWQNNGDDEGFSILPGLDGFANLEAIQDLAFVETSASVSRQLIDTREGDTNSNRELVQTYRASPYLSHRFGGFASSELRYTLTQVLVDDSDGDDEVSDETGHAGSLSLRSGEDFTRLLWSLSGGVSRAIRSDDDDVERMSADLGLEYVAAGWLSLTGGVGYQVFDDGDPENDVNGITWDAGVRVRPSPRLELTAGYGRRDDDESARGSLRYDIGPRTRFTASYEETLETSQERLVRDLASIGVDEETGQLIDPETGLPFDPNTSSVTIDDVTTRTKRFVSNLTGSRGRNDFRAGVAFIREETEGSDTEEEDENLVRVSAGWSRRLTPSLTGSISGSYAHTDFEDEDREDDTYSISGGLAYGFRENLSAFASYTFTQNTSSDRSEEYTANFVTVGVRIDF